MMREGDSDMAGDESVVLQGEGKGIFMFRSGAEERVARVNETLWLEGSSWMSGLKLSLLDKENNIFVSLKSADSSRPAGYRRPSRYYTGLDQDNDVCSPIPKAFVRPFHHGSYQAVQTVLGGRNPS
jgi:hypothetical protein